MCVLKMLYVLFLIKLRKLALYNNYQSHNVYANFRSSNTWKQNDNT